MSTYACGVSEAGNMVEIGGAFTTIAAENAQLLADLNNIRQELQTLKESRGDRKPITDRKGFERLGNVGGDEKLFGDWEFQLQQLLHTPRNWP